jgi:DNA polymerase II small subunit/DNA polymerase delta subunit B
MDKREIVRQLTQRGVLVTPEVLERIESGEIKAPDSQPATQPRERARLSATIRKTEKLKRMSPKDFVSYYSNRYNGLRKMLAEKMQAVSINRVGDITTEVAVIGMVRERNAQGFVLEDGTGEVSVASKDDVQEDDVVGVRGMVREGRIIQRELVWPDIPLSNRARSVPGLTLLLATFMNEKIRKAARDISLVFMHGPAAPEETEGNIMTALPNPCHAVINREGSEFRMLIYRPESPISPKEAFMLLRKRSLPPAREEIPSAEDPYLIDPVPDIFWVLSDRRHVERYKGVTIVMTGGHDAVKYDAGTGESFFAYG